MNWDEKKNVKITLKHGYLRVAISFHRSFNLSRYAIIVTPYTSRQTRWFFQQGVNEKVEENKKMMREHLVCPSQSNEKPLSQGIADSTTAKIIKILSSTPRSSTVVKQTTKIYQKNLSTPATPAAKSTTPVTNLSTRVEIKSSTG